PRHRFGGRHTRRRTSIDPSRSKSDPGRASVNPVAHSWSQVALRWTGLPARHSAPAETGACVLGMKMDVGPGSYVALVTPMTLDGQVDEESLRGLIRFHLDSGTDGIVALG
ncbi:unnamed protein product, partial [Ascophyllum nodosum]